MITNLLYKQMKLRPNHPALITTNTTYSFQDLWIKTTQIAFVLKKHLPTNTKRVALLHQQHPDLYLTILALYLLNIEIVLLHPKLTIKELQKQINDAHPEALITDPSLYHFNDISIPSIDLSQMITALNDTLACYLPDQQWDLKATCSIMYTSGTTGTAKGVRQTFENHISSALAAQLALDITEQDCWLCVLPLYHISGLSILMRSLVTGCSVYLLEQFNESHIVNLIHTHTITIASLVDTLAQHILLAYKQPTHLTHFKGFLIGGAALSQRTVSLAKQVKIPLYASYGMTETCSQILTHPVDSTQSPPYTVGTPLLGVNIHIHTKTPHTPGELWVKGPQMSPGYIGHAQQLTSYNDQGWFETGDIAYQDTQGHVYILDRRSDLIISGGENIYPAEVEHCLKQHPAIYDAGVVGIYDDLWGMRPVAWIVLKKPCTYQELHDFCRKHLASYKIPDQYYVTDSLPKNHLNKLKRKELAHWTKDPSKQLH